MENSLDLLSSQNSYPPGTSEHDLISKRGPWGFQQVKMRSDWIRMGPNLVTCVHKRRGKFGHKNTHRECHETIKAEIRIMCPQVQECQGLPATTRNQESGVEHSPSEPSEEANLPTPSSETSSFQIERISFYHFQSLSWQYFAMTALQALIQCAFDALRHTLQFNLNLHLVRQNFF